MQPSESVDQSHRSVNPNYVFRDSRAFLWNPHRRMISKILAVLLILDFFILLSLPPIYPGGYCVQRLTATHVRPLLSTRPIIDVLAVVVEVGAASIQVIHRP
ncbi:hypothetical protein SAY86_003508 [Trapa natans]|uniref:Uncharacterized protein n=1 Tax=Trapa natans TaxID=22666 RepID=A0AAN7N1U9_TRANT|nr:hypothetical protein SAY86_003508 [Trapa natans]